MGDTFIQGVNEPDWSFRRRKWLAVHGNKKERMVSKVQMSMDRVEFKIKWRWGKIPDDCRPKYCKDRDESQIKFCDLMLRVFGVNAHQIRDNLRVDRQSMNIYLFITCRPSQFARFLILRNELGFQNGFKDLDAKMVQPEEKPVRMNVAHLPNEYWTFQEIV